MISMTPNYEEVDQNVTLERDHTDMNEDAMRPLYSLFVLPLFVVFLGILCVYLKNFLNERLHGILQMVENYMVSVDQDFDPDQTPVKVIERLNSMVTEEGSSLSDLDWDDSIERNAQVIANDLTKDSDNKNSTQSDDDSIINVDLSDYLNLVEKIEAVQANKDKGQRSSSPISETFHQTGIDFTTSPNHFPSFNLQMEESSEVDSDKEESTSIDFNHKEGSEEKIPSMTRSGKVYKSI